MCLACNIKNNEFAYYAVFGLGFRSNNDNNDLNEIHIHLDSYFNILNQKIYCKYQKNSDFQSNGIFYSPVIKYKKKLSKKYYHHNDTS